MKSKISFFNAGLFKSNLRRFWPLWVGHFLIWLVCTPLLLLLGRVGDTLYPTTVFETVQSCIYSSPYAAAIMAGLSAFAVFGFMYTNRSTGLIASLPVRREAVFCSACLAAVIPVLASNVIIALLTFLFALTSSASGDMIFGVAATWFAVYSMEFILFFGLAALCAVLTGSAVFFPVLYGILNFLVYGLELCARSYMCELVWGLSYDSETTLDALSPLVYLTNSTGYHLEYDYNASESVVTSAEFNGWLPVIIYFAVGLIFIAAALLIFRKRRMETTSEFVAVPALRPVFKYGIAACAAFVGGLMLYEISSVWLYDAPALIVMLPCMFVCGFIGCYGAEMLLKKSFHVFKKGWLGYVVLCCCCIIFVLCCDLDILGEGTMVPDANDVKSVYTDYAENSVKNPENVEALVELQSRIVEKRDEYKDLLFSDVDVTYIRFDYTLKNGRQFSRLYYLPYDSEEYTAYLELLSTYNFQLELLTPSVPADVKHCYGGYITFYYKDDYWELSPEEACDFYKNALMKDLKNEATGLICNDGSLVEYANVYIEFYDLNDEGDYSEYSSISANITEQCTACIEWISEHYDIDITSYADEAAG